MTAVVVLIISARKWSGPGAFLLGSFFSAEKTVSRLKGEGYCWGSSGVLWGLGAGGSLWFRIEPLKMLASWLAISFAACCGPFGEL